MSHIDYLFMFRSEGCDPAIHRAVMATPEGDATFVGVTTIDQAREVADTALADGRLPVGFVTYLPEERPKIDALFGDG